MFLIDQMTCRERDNLADTSSVEQLLELSLYIENWKLGRRGVVSDFKRRCVQHNTTGKYSIAQTKQVGVDKHVSDASTADGACSCHKTMLKALILLPFLFDPLVMNSIDHLTDVSVATCKKRRQRQGKEKWFSLSSFLIC